MDKKTGISMNQTNEQDAFYEVQTLGMLLREAPEIKALLWIIKEDHRDSPFLFFVQKIRTRRSERKARRLLLAVDRIISRAAEVDFAANSKRSCCG